MIKLLYLFTLMFLLFSCYGEKWTENKVDQLLKTYQTQNGTEVVLSDMRVGRNENSFYHKYEVFAPDQEGNYQKIKTVEDPNVTEGFFALNSDNLGMSIGRITKEGIKSTMVAPAGFEMVIGNPKYGEFSGTDNTGNWVFYPRYSHYPLLFYWGNRQIHRQYYNMYRTGYRNNRHFYGPTNAWGTNSAESKRTHKGYYTRARQRANSWKRNYSNSSNYRGGGGWGK